MRQCPYAGSSILALCCRRHALAGTAAPCTQIFLFRMGEGLFAATISATHIKSDIGRRDPGTLLARWYHGFVKSESGC